jgi:membrane-bound acyltransferase YfiQ involved in biofilm formation
MKKYATPNILDVAHMKTSIIYTTFTQINNLIISSTGFITRLLSARFFQPLSKLSYSIFLTHYIILMVNTGRIRTALYIDEYVLVSVFLLRLELNINCEYLSASRLCWRCLALIRTCPGSLPGCRSASIRNSKNNV